MAQNREYQSAIRVDRRTDVFQKVSVRFISVSREVSVWGAEGIVVPCQHDDDMHLFFLREVLSSSKRARTCVAQISLHPSRCDVTGEVDDDSISHEAPRRLSNHLARTSRVNRDIQPAF